MRFDSLQETLTRAGFSVHTFPTGQAAKDWLAAQWSGKTIGLGGSMTLEDLGLYEALSQGNTVYWHWRTPRGRPPLGPRPPRPRSTSPASTPWRRQGS